MSILNAYGQPAIHASEKKVYHEFTLSDSIGRRKMITLEKLVDPNRRLIVNDTLKILCQIWIHGKIKKKVETDMNRPSKEERIQFSKGRLANDLGKLLYESISSDVTISTGETSFNAHKAILSARSSVFAAMFRTNMLERETAALQIVDFDKEVVKGMLEHLYTGETTVMADRAEELLQIAEKYNLEGLKEDCENAIVDKLAKDNAAEILVLAHSHNAPILKSQAIAISFIGRNKEELMKMKSFQDAVKSFAHTGVFVDLYLSTTK